MHMDAMMQTSKQKVEKFFIFFVTKLGMLQKWIRYVGGKNWVLLSGHHTAGLLTCVGKHHSH